MKISEIPVGGYLVFGQFRQRGDRTPTNLIWRKGSVLNEFYVQDGIGMFCADAKEPENESRDRRERGSNFFPQLNICQFLNATENSWYKPQHDTDTVDDTLKNTPGFLHLFEEWERKLIIPHEVVTAVPAGFRRKYGEKVKTVLNVSMLSRSQILGGEDLTEGSQLEVFENGVTISGLLTRSAVNTGLYAIDYRRRLTSQCPAMECNIVPFLCLNGDCPVEFIEDCYYVFPPEEVVKEITNELHELLK